MLNRSGKVASYYVEKERFTEITGFFSAASSGASVTIQTDRLEVDGKLVVDGVTNGIDETVKKQIRKYLNLPAEHDRPENPCKEMGKGKHRLHLKQAEIMKRNGKPAQQMEAIQDMERRRK